MNRDRDKSGRLGGGFAPALAVGVLAVAISGPALATPGKGGGCGGCGSGGRGSHISPHVASQTAGHRARAAVSESGASISIRYGGRPSEALGYEIAQLGATLAENARRDQAERARRRY